MIRNLCIYLCILSLIIATVAPYAGADVVVLKKGGKYVGKVEDQGDKIKITTDEGPITVSKDSIKAIYKDASVILKETYDVLANAQVLIDGANKIQDGKERNASLNKAIEMLEKAEAICWDVAEGAYPEKESKAIGERIKDIKTKIKHAKAFLVSDAETPKPPPPKDTPPAPDKPETKKAKPRKVDDDKMELARECYKLGVSSFNDKKYEDAKENFNKALSYDENYAEAYARLGDTYEMLKEEEVAYENYQRCIEIIDAEEPPSAELSALRDEVKKKTEKFKALEDKLAALNKEFIARLMELGNQCMEDKDYSLAEEIFALILQVEESNKDAFSALQKAREELEKEAAKEVEKDSDEK